MNKFIAYLGIALMSVLAWSCQSEEDMPEGGKSGYVDVTMSTSLPTALQSYATSSVNSGLQNLEGESNLYVRYIMEVYQTLPAQGPEQHDSKKMVERVITYKPLTAEGDYRNETFPSMRLIANQYDFVFWADIVKKVNASAFTYGAPTSLLNATEYYVNPYFVSAPDNTTILYSDGAETFAEGNLQHVSSRHLADPILKPVNAEMLDAYTVSKKIDLRSEPGAQSVVLKRPFAKVRVVTTDADVLAKEDGTYRCAQVSAIVPDAGNVYNALSGNISRDLLTTNLNTPVVPDYPNEYPTPAEAGKTNKTIGVNYLFAPANATTVILSVRLFENADDAMPLSTYTVDVDNVPFETNKITTIKGNLLSKNATFSIIIEDEFDQPVPDDVIVEDIEVATVDALKAKLNGKNQKITYTGTVTKTDGFNLDFSTVVSTTRSEGTPLYANGNTANVEIVFTNAEEGALIALKGGNAPYALKITNQSSKAPNLLADLPNTFVSLNGGTYTKGYWNFKVNGKSTNTSLTKICFTHGSAEGLDLNNNTLHAFEFDDTLHLTDIGKDMCIGNAWDGHECSLLSIVVNLDKTYTMLQLMTNGKLEEVLANENITL